MTFTLSVFWCGFGSGVCVTIVLFLVLAWLLGRKRSREESKPADARAERDQP